MDAEREPLVTIIGLSYNHAPYIKAALISLFNQSYSNIEIILVDDASTDGSAAIIQELIQGKNIVFIQNHINQGNCISFNSALKIAKGKYIVDFALDDILYPDRIKKQVNVLEAAADNVGVVFTNVDIIDKKGNLLQTHYPAYYHPLHRTAIPEGEVFEAVLSRYYINPVSILARRTVFDKLNGYDEQLAYEDFDFWIRSSRLFNYVYLPEILSAKRLTPDSLSGLFYKKNQEHMFASTLVVCKKAWWLCSTESEKKALVVRCRYETRQALNYGYGKIVKEYLTVLKEVDPYYYLYAPVAWVLLSVKKYI
jgi:glycosyltransferase involved in cell wall biosynthesis